MSNTTDSDAELRPFRVLGLQQIALGALDRTSFEPLWFDCLGLSPHDHFKSDKENVDEVIALLGRGLGRVELDLMQPIDAQSKPRVDQPTLNHIGLWVDDLAAAQPWLEARGVRFTPGGLRKGAAGHDVCFIHPKPNAAFPISGNGALIELVQAPADLIAEYDAARS